MYVRQWRRYLEYRKSIVEGYKTYCAYAATSAIFENKVTEKLKRETGTACGRNQIRASYSTTEYYVV